MDNYYHDDQGYCRTKLTRKDFADIGYPTYGYDCEIISLMFINKDDEERRSKYPDLTLYNIQFRVDSWTKQLKEFNEKERPKLLAEIAELEKQIEAEKKAGK